MLLLALLALAVPGAYGQSVEIVSPNHAYTFAYGDAILHQIERDHLTNQMIAPSAIIPMPVTASLVATRHSTLFSRVCISTRH